MQISRPSGMPAFTIVWFGQVISLMGSSMTGFAITIWAWQTTGSATALALVGFFAYGSRVIFSPIAGALVDRWNRKLVMMISDLASGLMSVVIFFLVTSNSLQIWHLCLTSFIAGAFQAFQWPAYSASISLMIPKKHYSRAAAMMSMAEWGSGVFAPVLAGALILTIQLQGILLIDIVTFLFAISVLMWIKVPQPKQTEEGEHAKGSLLQDSTFGFKYIWQRKSLFWLQIVFFGGNFLAAFGNTVFLPMILARTQNNTLLVGSLESAGAVGGIAGALLITAWGGPKIRVRGVLWGWFIAGLFGLVLLGSTQSVPIWVVSMFLGSFVGPIINSSNQAIWQSKVAPDIQGRVFSARLLIAQVSGPLAMLLAGPTADRWLEPAMAASNSPLAGTFGWLTGTGPGSGMALMIIFSGLAVTLVAIVGMLNPLVRNVETLLPDHKAEVNL
jgi:DHA3 family macrolide efflux protein-like MFS transporter